MIAKLIQVWNARPQRVEPDDAAHLEYIFTKLLPAVRDAMPTIENAYNNGAMPIVREQVAIPVHEESQSIPLTPAPVLEPSSHTPAVIPNTAGNGEVLGQTEGNAGKPASLPETPAVVTKQVVNKRTEALKRARAAKAKKAADALLAPPQETAETEKS